MATRMWLPSGGTVPTISPGAVLSSNGGIALVRSNTATTKQNTALTTRASTFPTNYAGLSNRGNSMFVGPAMSAQTVAGTFSLVVKCSGTVTNYGGGSTPPWMRVAIRVFTSTNTFRGTLFNADATYTTTADLYGQVFAATLETRIVPVTALTSLAVLDGDRLVIEIGIRADPGTDDHSYSFVWGDPSATADHTLVAGQTMVGVPWIEFSGDLFGAVAPPIPSGSASGHTTFTGAASGTTARRGIAAGTALFTGLALGTALHTGTATGHTTWAGTAIGVTPAVSTRTGSASGTTTWTGHATGIRTTRGTATGSTTFTGTATGTAPAVGAKQGSATGHTTWAGAASGIRVSRGTATGATTWTGRATGLAPTVGGKYGAASGSTVWTGSASGRRNPVGAAAGVYTFTGTAAGATTRKGATAGAWVFTGHASGHTGQPLRAPVVHRAALTLATPQARTELDDTMTYTEGDLEPALTGHVVGTIRANHPTLTDAAFNALTPYPIDLTNATTITAHLRKTDATILTRAVTRGDQGVDPGSWSMPWQVGDLSCAGTWTGEVEVSWPGVRPQTFGSISFPVARQIA